MCIVADNAHYSHYILITYMYRYSLIGSGKRMLILYSSVRNDREYGRPLLLSSISNRFESLLIRGRTFPQDNYYHRRDIDWKL